MKWFALIVETKDGFHPLQKIIAPSYAFAWDCVGVLIPRYGWKLTEAVKLYVADAEQPSSDYEMATLQPTGEMTRILK